MQTEILRGFESFTASCTLRLQKVETNQTTLDTTLSGRVVILENRLLQIEQRLFGSIK
ncbi:MAG: hypothetical protein H7Y20_17180 [Bryobacteraceae bacterium]|nr:hypothetical protein [Bryobacteraceae bacterium]